MAALGLRQIALTRDICPNFDLPLLIAVANAKTGSPDISSTIQASLPLNGQPLVALASGAFLSSSQVEFCLQIFDELVPTASKRSASLNAGSLMLLLPARIVQYSLGNYSD
jgi:hypothetical protein